MDAFGSDIGVGYNCGCKLGITLAKSDLGLRAAYLNFRTLVGTFHGHAHNRLCQTRNLGTYIEGRGNDALEHCKDFFSQSNQLTSSIRHASRFHRHQELSQYFQHSDWVVKYEALSQTLLSAYRRALSILDGEVAFHGLLLLMEIADTSIFESWLQEEMAYLTARLNSLEPVEETAAIEYYLALAAMKDQR
jgi:hypothetical protein